MIEFPDETWAAAQSAYDRRTVTPLKELNLSQRTYNALVRGGIKSVEELLQLSADEVGALYMIGPTALEEIDTKLFDYRTKGEWRPRDNQTLSDRKQIPTTSVLAELSADVISKYPADQWRTVSHTLADDVTPITELGLTPVFQQRLLEANLNTVADLAQVSVEQLQSLPSVGGRSISKLRTALISHLLRANSSIDPYPKQKDPGLVAETPPRQDALASLVSSDRAALLMNLPLDRIPVDRLALTQAQFAELDWLQIYTIGRLVDYSGYLQAKDPIRVLLQEYLSTTEPNQIALSAVSLEDLQRHRLSKTTDVSLWLTSLPQKERNILESYFGLYGPAFNLSELGSQLTLSRERIRQIKARTLQRLKKEHSNAITFVAQSLTSHVRDLGGVISKVDAADWFQAQQDPASHVDPQGALELLVALTDCLKYQSKSCMFLTNGLPDASFDTISRVLTDALQARMAPTALDVLLDDVRASSDYQMLRKKWPGVGIDLDVFVIACLRASESFVEQEPGVFARSGWDNRIADKIVVALRELGEPAHFTLITETVNGQLPPDRQSTAHNIHAQMLRYEEVFARVGHGIYALAEWGRKKDNSLAEAAARFLRETGHPLHSDTITDHVLQSWQVNRSSVYAALSFDGYYRDESGLAGLCMLLGEGVFSLSEWEAARASETTPFLPYCPPALPDPPDFDNALFESVMVANKLLMAAPRAGRFLTEMFTWAKYDGEPRRWLQQGVLNCYYLLGLIPYTYVFGGEDPQLRSTLPAGTISDIRESCLVNLTHRLAHMREFWGVLRDRTPAREMDLAEVFVPMRPDGLNDTHQRLALLTGMGAAVRGQDYQYRLTPVGVRLAEAWGLKSADVATTTEHEHDAEPSQWDDLTGLGYLE